MQGGLCSAAAAAGERRVVLALYRAMLRSARRYERHSPRALSEIELQTELEELECGKLRESGSGALLSQLIRTDFRSNMHEQPDVAISEAISRGFLALRKIDSLNCPEAVPAEAKVAQPKKGAYSPQLSRDSHDGQR
jgi:hypothetical protein